MPVSRESASSEAGATRHLIVGLNWLGDAVMSLPAVAALRTKVPQASITVLVRPNLDALWRMVPGVEVLSVSSNGAAGLLRAVMRVRRGGYGTAWVMPKSLRAALIARLGGVPQRVGLAGHARDWLLTRVVKLPVPDVRHQQYEYLDLVGMTAVPAASGPWLSVPEAARGQVAAALREWNPNGAPVIGVFPGAARGPSKRWPAERFAEVCRRLSGERPCRVVVLGAAADRHECATVTSATGETARDLSGKTSLDVLAAWLSACRVVVGNDSGGIHLAAALGIPVVAVYGLTDPVKTGPIGQGHRLIVAEGVHASRKVARDSEAAREALRSIAVAQVHQAAADVLSARGVGAA